MNRNIFPLFVFTMLAACTSQKQLSSVNYAPLYYSPVCDPEFKIYHFSNDSSLFYFSFTNSDLLFKKNESGSFEACLELAYSLYTGYNNATILDSASSVFNVAYDSLGTGYTGTMKFKALTGNEYILKIMFKDLNRSQNYVYTVNVKKSNWQSSQFFDLRYPDEQPIMQAAIAKNVKVKIIPPVTANESIAVRCYFRHFPLAPPPFSENPLTPFEYAADKIFYVKTADLNKMQFDKEGFYHLQFDTTIRDGFTIYCYDDNFPNFTRPEQLIESLRYLCTRTEYDDLQRKADKKKAIDDYWLAKAGNNERGRKLIKVYYNRSFIANKLFTSYLEGWKTDRGMIYIVFGPPQSVYRNKKYESWRYTQSAGIPDMQFIFTKVSNPFSDNDFELERNINYQSIWYQVVDAWRSGRIVGEY